MRIADVYLDAKVSKSIPLNPWAPRTCALSGATIRELSAGLQHPLSCTTILDDEIQFLMPNKIVTAEFCKISITNMLAMDNLPPKTRRTQT
ncbi:hypothetical protein J6590_040297 [Homalodisca vitripennis]|nr:hypothetical protein J6590_040297 [Homalodisca vitripennis]